MKAWGVLFACCVGQIASAQDLPVYDPSAPFEVVTKLDLAAGQFLVKSSGSFFACNFLGEAITGRVHRRVVAVALTNCVPILSEPMAPDQRQEAEAALERDRIAKGETATATREEIVAAAEYGIVTALRETDCRLDWTDEVAKQAAIERRESLQLEYLSERFIQAQDERDPPRAFPFAYENLEGRGTTSFDDETQIETLLVGCPE